MKILFVIDTYQTNNNGTSISAQRFAAELRKRGHEVRILTTGTPSENIYALNMVKIPVFQGLIEKHGFQFAAREAEVVTAAVQWADVVHCFMPFALESYAKTMADRLGKPATAAFHIQPENLTSSVNLGKVAWITNAVYRGFRHFIYDRFTHVHTPSQFMADEIIKRGYSAKIHVISNGIQDDFVWTKRQKSSEFEGKILIMMVGRLSVEKRQDVIINAVKHSKYAEKIQLVFAGKGPKYDDYVALGQSLKNPPIFAYYNRKELINTLAQCDLYVHSSDMESEAISCIEAFATGLVPVIANSELSATPQFALDGRSLFMPGSPKDLARAIDYWLDHPDERARMERHYAAAARKYNIEHSIDQFEDMLYEAVTEYAPAEVQFA